ncbi:hypothetical protein H312_02605, partial [Anncaliia algerae PRA339]
LLNRKELNVLVTHEQKPSPSKKAVIAILSNLFKTKDSNIVVKTISTRYGSNETKCDVRIYESPETMKKLEERVKRSLNRRARKAAKKQKAKIFGTLRRHVKKQEKRQNK